MAPFNAKAFGVFVSHVGGQRDSDQQHPDTPVTVLSGHGSIFQLVVSRSQLLTVTSLSAEPSARYPQAFCVAGKSGAIRTTE